jgi:regulator of protease activity HflC (stomatin/prohibitin superfamily)
MGLESHRAEDIDEKEAGYIPGIFALIVGLGIIAGLAWMVWINIAVDYVPPPFFKIVLAALTFILLTRGLIVLEPKQALVLTFFGKYAGTIRRDGFWWFNPLCARHKISLRVVNMTTPTLKVNDFSGNPIEVAAVVVWCVQDTARAVFAVENYQGFIAQQAESALRQVAGTHPYDADDKAKSLRGNVEAVSNELKETIGDHVAIAGVEIIDARLAHLAYAPEIAGVMLRRQQAQAILAARRIIVEGTVGLVQLAIDELQAGKVVQFNDSQRAQLVTNLMTVLVSDKDVSPVVQMQSAAG